MTIAQHAHRQSLLWKARRNLQQVCPQPILNWGAEMYHAKYGEIELHLVEFLCRPDRDAIDVGAHGGCYVYWLRRYARHVFAFEPLPWLAERLARKFGDSVTVRDIALGGGPGTATLSIPMIDGVAIEGCASLSPASNPELTTHRDLDVKIAALDDIYNGDVGFMKIDVEGVEEAVLDGARRTIARYRPHLLIEIEESMSPGGIGRISLQLEALGYAGFYVRRGGLAPIDTFDIATMQRPRDRPSLTGQLSDRPRFPVYINNFLFLSPAGRPEALRKIDAKIASL